MSEQIRVRVYNLLCHVIKILVPVAAAPKHAQVKMTDRSC